MSSSGFTIGSGRGKLGGLIGAAVFAVAGTVLFWDLHKEVVRREVPCTFLESRIVEEEPYGEGDTFYVLRVRYTYTVGGETYTSDVLKDPYWGSRNRAETEALAAQFPEGARRVCYVSWFDATDVTLEKPFQFLWLFVAFPFVPLILVLLGLVGGAVWRRIRGRKRAAGEAPVGPLTQRKVGSHAGSMGCMILFFGVFFAVGSATLFFFFIRPVYRTATSEDWVEVPCTIISSEVGSHSDSDSTTYSIDITYTYEFEGKTYESDDYDFMGGSSSGYEGKARVVASYPPGSRKTCFVNPDKPSQAVLHRGFSWTLLFGLIPLVFVMVGAGGVIFSIRGHRKQKATLTALTRTVEARPGSLLGREATPVTRRVVVPAETEWLPKSALKFAGERGPVELEPEASPRAKVIGMLVAALFWNGLLSVFLHEAYVAWMRGDPDWGLTLFLIPFVLVGFGFIGAAFYFLLASFNPQPFISVSSRLVPLGGAFEVSWLFSGNIHRLSALRIYLEGREEAKYQRGTKTYTDKETFAEIDIVTANDMATIARGEIALAVPDTTIHSFQSRHNKIIWTLKVHGAIHRWPDVKSDYEIVLLPKESLMEALE